MFFLYEMKNETSDADASGRNAGSNVNSVFRRCRGCYNNHNVFGYCNHIHLKKECNQEKMLSPVAI